VRSDTLFASLRAELKSATRENGGGVGGWWHQPARSATGSAARSASSNSQGRGKTDTPDTDSCRPPLRVSSAPYSHSSAALRRGCRLWCSPYCQPVRAQSCCSSALRSASVFKDSGVSGCSPSTFHDARLPPTLSKMVRRLNGKAIFDGSSTWSKNTPARRGSAGLGQGRGRTPADRPLKSEINYKARLGGSCPRCSGGA